jgi:hypothetical protein
MPMKYYMTDGSLVVILINTLIRQLRGLVEHTFREYTFGEEMSGSRYMALTVDNMFALSRKLFLEGIGAMPLKSCDYFWDFL